MFDFLLKSFIINLLVTFFVPSLFLRFCFERGHVAQANHKGDYGKLPSYLPRPHDDWLWPEGSIQKPVPCWNGFRSIWKERLPKLQIWNVCEDTCPECYILKNKFKYLGRGKKLGAAHHPCQNQTTQRLRRIITVRQLRKISIRMKSFLKKQTDMYKRQSNSKSLLVNDKTLLWLKLRMIIMAEAENDHEDRRFFFSFFTFF